MSKMRSKAFKTLRVVFALLAALAVFSAAGAVAADSYPTKPVRLIIPFPPGGSNDIVGRLMAAKLSERLGKQVVADNRGGAGGVLGTEMAVKADPDGYTLLIVSAAFTFNPSLYKLPYDSIKDFVPVAKMASGPNSLVLHPSVPAKTVKELIALMKEKPGKVIASCSGVGSFQHLGAELFKMEAGVDFPIVQFKGGGPQMVDQLGGHSHLSFGSLIQTLPHIKSGKFRVLGTGGSKRSKILPDVPTIAEAGVPGYEANNWWGILARAGTPEAIVNRLTKEIEGILSSEEVQKLFLKQGAEEDFTPPKEFKPYIANEIAKWSRVVKAANIKVK